MIATETPILESVFVALADNATDIGTVFDALGNLPLPDWATSPLSYAELAELATDASNGVADTLWMVAR